MDTMDPLASIIVCGCLSVLMLPMSYVMISDWFEVQSFEPYTCSGSQLANLDVSDNGIAAYGTVATCASRDPAADRRIRQSICEDDSAYRLGDMACPALATAGQCNAATSPFSVEVQGACPLACGTCTANQTIAPNGVDPTGTCNTDSIPIELYFPPLNWRLSGKTHEEVMTWSTGPSAANTFVCYVSPDTDVTPRPAITHDGNYIGGWFLMFLIGMMICCGGCLVVVVGRSSTEPTTDPL